MTPERLVSFDSSASAVRHYDAGCDLNSISPSVGLFQKWAFWMVWLLMFAAPWENAIVIPGFGTISRVIGVATLFVGLLAILESGRLRAPASQHYLMVLFVSWVSASYFWSVAEERTRTSVITFLQLLLMVWLIWEFAQTYRNQMRLLQAYVLGTCISSAAVVFSYLAGSGTQNGRYTGFGFNPGDLGLILALSLPISLFLASRAPTGLSVSIYAAHITLAVSAILLTASRGTLLASLPTALMIGFLYVRLSTTQKTVGLLLLLTAGIVGGMIAPSSSWSRLGTIQEEIRTGTLNDRTLIWQTGWQVFTRSPFIGVGSRAYAPSVERSIGLASQAPGQDGDMAELVAHNTFLSILVELGVVGFTLFAALLLALAYNVWRSPSGERLLWVCVLLTWTIGVCGLTWEDRKPTWILFGVLIAVTSSQATSRTPKSQISQRHFDSGLRTPSAGQR
jgi:O-antigen ligase